MKTILALLLATVFLSCGNEEEKQTIRNNTSTESNFGNPDFSEIWLCSLWGKSFQGVLGDDYQRIEIKFLSVKPAENNRTYHVIGKSRVNNNICTFKGTIQILDIIRNTDEDKDALEYYDGQVIGTYKFSKNPDQKHSGFFEGKFSTKFLFTEEHAIIADFGHYTLEGLNEFKGTWTSYQTSESKRCDWGLLPPDCKELFRHHENEVYMFNYKYIDKGWKSYILNGVNMTFAVTDFENPDKSKVEITGENQEAHREHEVEKWW